MKRVGRLVGIPLALACVLLAAGCDEGPSTPPGDKSHTRGRASGMIRNRVRIIVLRLAKIGFTPNPIAVYQGERVQILVTSEDARHGFEIPAYGIRADVAVGEHQTLTFDALEPGKFPIVCTCGVHAPGTEGMLIVWERMFVQRWLARYGQAALFGLLMFGIAGIPMPDEVMLTFAGGLAWTGNYNMSYLGTVLTAFLGASCGISFSYALGRTAGLGLVHRWGKRLHVTPERLNRSHDWFVRGKGRWALTFCIFLPVFRHVTAIVAGTSKMPLWEFAACAYSGVLLWVSTFITLGYFSAEYWVRMSKKVHVMLLAGSLLIGAMVLAWVILRSRAARRPAH